MTKLEPIKARGGLICYINNVLTRSRARLSAFTIFAHELLIKRRRPVIGRRRTAVTLPRGR